MPFELGKRTRQRESQLKIQRHWKQIPFDLFSNLHGLKTIWSVKILYVCKFATDFGLTRLKIYTIYKALRQLIS